MLLFLRLCRQGVGYHFSTLPGVFLLGLLMWTSVSVAQQIEAEGSLPAFTQTLNYRLERGAAIIDQVYSVESAATNSFSRSGGGYAGRIVILVGTSLYSSIQDSLTRLYVADLQAEGYSVKVFTISGGVGDDVRALLRANQADLRGAMMIGDVPVPYWKFRTHAGAGAMDLAYMDLNGEWTDTTGDGFWDVAAPGSGDLGAEIWIGWLYPVKMGTLTKQVSLINDYLSRNHQYRVGNTIRQSRAKMYLNGQWARDNAYGIGGIDSALSSLYSGVSRFKDSTITGTKTYLDSLQADYEFWFVTTHSGYSLQSLETPTGIEYVRWADIDSINPMPLFYYIYACGVGAYYLDSCIANYYVLGSTSGLTLVASVVVGGMGFYSIHRYLDQVNEGKNFGEALVDYFRASSIPDPASWEDFNSIMETILGDPTLRAARQSLVVKPDGSGDAATIQAAIDTSRDGARVLLAPGVYRGVGNRDIDYRGKHVTVAPEGISTQVMIDCEHSGRGFWFHSGETFLSRLASVTIINGAANDSGGAILIEGNSSPQIVDCLIRDNVSSGNGGAVAIYGDGAALVKNCTIARNAGVPGGGIFLQNGASRIENCIVAFNGQGGVYYSGSDSAAISCSDLFGNQGGEWHGATNLSGINGNLVADPKFCDTALSLFGISNISPCFPTNDGCSFLIGSEPVSCFDVCGDANTNGSINISDAVYLIAYIFFGGPAPNPFLAGDANCNGTVNISDAVYLIAYIFSGGPAPCALCK